MTNGPAGTPGSPYEGRAKELVAFVALLIAATVITAGDEAHAPAPASPVYERAAVYRIEWQTREHGWQVWSWLSADGPHRGELALTHRRTCIRKAPTHRCRTVLEARFDSHDAAVAYRRARCHTAEEAQGRPPGMDTC